MRWAPATIRPLSSECSMIFWSSNGRFTLVISFLLAYQAYATAGDVDTLAIVPMVQDSWQQTPAVSSALSFPEAISESPSREIADANVQQAQFGLGTALSVQLGLDAQARVNQPLVRRGLGSASVGALASIPFMIGDTTAGTCVSFNTIGYLEADIAHPTFTCSRLNISENNQTLTTDRVYCSYRHFHNATPFAVFNLSETLNIDRYTLGLEKRLFDGLWSLEVRQPIDYRLKSNSRTFIADGNGDPFDGPEQVSLNDGRRAEFANMSLILKRMLIQEKRFAASCGLGLTLPTAQDLSYQATIDNVFLTADSAVPPFVAQAFYDLEVRVDNRTVYLAPFLSWSHRPTDRFFHQGFLQVEFAANPQQVTLEDNGSTAIVFQTPPAFVALWTVDDVFGGQATVPLQAQTLLRLNLGCGYFLVDEPRNRYLKQLAALFEVHYTTPLQDANLSELPLEFIQVTSGDAVPNDAADPIVGNRNSSIDIINATLGVSARIGKTTITNGFTAPLTDNDNRGFDFEYNLQVQREF